MFQENSTIVWFEHCGSDDAVHLGGKVAHLGELLRAGFPVPQGFAVTTDAYQQFLTTHGLQDALDGALRDLHPDDVAASERLSHQIRGLIESMSIPDAVAEPIAISYQQLCQVEGDEALPVAIRSSAVGEDGVTSSFAGQQESYLWIRGPEAVLDHVRRCWSSLYTPQVLAYRARLGLDQGAARISVAVQCMVDARAAGVMFTLSPTNGDRSAICIEGNWGLGLSVVGGEVTPDRYLVDKVTLQVRERNIYPKPMAYRVDPDTCRVVPIDVPSDQQNLSCLTDEELRLLASLGKRIERHYGRPQDIEWAIDSRLDGEARVRILQSRPETVWSARPAQPLVQPSQGPLDYMLNYMLKPKKIEL